MDPLHQQAQQPINLMEGMYQTGNVQMDPMMPGQQSIVNSDINIIGNSGATHHISNISTNEPIQEIQQFNDPMQPQDMNLQQTSLDPSCMQNGQSNINGSTAPY